jgi:hypothetical protein
VDVFRKKLGTESGVKMNQKSVVVMPTLKRTEMLALSLEALSLMRRDSDPDVRIFLDHTHDQRLNEVRLAETEFVRDHYFPTAEIFHANNHILTPGGCWNILQSLKAGYETGADFVFFVEEDVLVRPDFFDRHLELQASGDYFVTSGRKLAYFDDTFYSNPGTCYRREKLAQVIPHICDQYFANPKAYLEQHFPHMDDAGILDDGLIRRVMRSLGEKAKCAVPAVAQHVGFHYYQKMPQYKNEGRLEDRIAWIREFLSDIPARKAADPRYIGDLEELP